MSKWMLQTKNLTKQINNQLILDHVDLHLPIGKIYGLLGPNGAGKTTLMKLILGLQRKTSGTIVFMDELLNHHNREIYTRSGSLLEEPAFYGNLTAYENLKIFAEMRGVAQKGAIETTLRNVRLDQTGKKKFQHFSLGMKQRLGIAAALLHEPELLILDEPINGLDPIGIREIREMLIFLNQKYKTTILISSHILSEIEQMADTIGVLNKGRLVKEISLEELKSSRRDFLKVRVNDLKQAAFLLEERLDIHDYEVSGKNYLHIYAAEINPAAITKIFVESGIAVSELSHQTFHLEEYFNQLLGGDSHALSH
ncbi:ABC transporter ATP-binding protein [Enterococcus sp. LJL128]|uniref:ABC transporter ATP-binding protein n=1 Tax=Enterococcus sp. LJL51 TaxID=3416656 RepID=UPI003CF93AD1